MSEFDLVDVISFPKLRLARAGIVPQEERGEDKAEQQLKIQLLFYGRRVDKNGDEIIIQSEIKNLHRALGDKILIKFKVGEEVFQQFMRLGMDTGSECDWDAVPQVWFFKDKNGNSKNGIWYKPAALLKLDGKDINYQILAISKPKRAEMQDAFAYFKGKAGIPFGGVSWGNELGNLENQINAELEGAAP